MQATFRHRAYQTLLAAACVVGMAHQADAQPTHKSSLDFEKHAEVRCERQDGDDACGHSLRRAARSTALLDESPALPLWPHTAQQAKGRDSVLNGVLIGAGVGALLGLIPDYYDDCEECHDSLYASIAVGAGVGLLVDLLKGRPAPSPSRAGDVFAVDVAVAPARVGVGGRLRWR